MKSGAAGVAALAIAPACGEEVSVPSGPIPAGNLANTPVGTLKLIDRDGVVLGRDDGGLYAMSALCTHAGCIVNVIDNGPGTAKSLFCGCHGSQFDAVGNVTHSPALNPLRHYQVDVDADGNITIQGAEPVSPDIRTQVT